MFQLSGFCSKPYILKAPAFHLSPQAPKTPKPVVNPHNPQTKKKNSLPEDLNLKEKAIQEVHWDIWGSFSPEFSSLSSGLGVGVEDLGFRVYYSRNQKVGTSLSSCP